MRILSCKIDPSKSFYADVQVPEGSIALSVTIPKMLTKVIGLDPVDLNPLVNVGIPSEADEDTKLRWMHIQIVTTGDSDDGMTYIDSIWWNNAIYHIFYDVID
jgi:hypothetical protein